MALHRLRRPDTNDHARPASLQGAGNQLLQSLHEFPVEPRPVSARPARLSNNDKCIAGVKKKSTAVSSAIAPVNAITCEFNPRSSQKGMRLMMFAGMSLVNMCKVQEFSNSPARVPAPASTKPSV